METAMMKRTLGGSANPDKKNAKKYHVSNTAYDQAKKSGAANLTAKEKRELAAAAAKKKK
jgi:hypothetical protein